VIDRTEFILTTLKELYAMPDMQGIYSTAYILDSLFEPEEITQELIQKVKNIINRKNKNGKPEAKAA
jgi:hypothetical protein